MTFRGLRRRRSTLIALPVVAVFVGTALTGSTLASFSDAGQNSGSSFSAGTIVLANNDTGTANLTFTGLQPGASGSKCFLVTSTGTAPSTVKLYLASVTSTNSLSSNLSLTITQGTGTSQTCSDFAPLSSGSALGTNTLAAAAAGNSYALGIGTWTPTGSGTETRTFQLSWTLSATAPASTQGSTATIAVVWEGRTT